MESSEITLTEDEKQMALASALRKKKAALREIEYWKKVKEKPEPKSFLPEQYRHRFMMLGREKFGNDFQFDADTDTIISILSLYLSKHKQFEQYGSVRKGILLIGPVGCGKTTIMKFFQLNQNMSYLVKSVRDIANEFADEGHSVIKKYSGYSQLGFESMKLFHQKYGGYCFDDLGTEDEKKNFGNEANVMQNILLNRYDGDMPLNYTHVTTNLTAEQIREFYGERLASRMREMFNVIEFSPNAKDKRQ